MVLLQESPPEIELMVTPPFHLRVRGDRASILALVDRVQINAVEGSSLGVHAAADSARLLLTELPRTPVSALGFNLGLQGEKPNEQLERLLSATAAHFRLEHGRTRLQLSQQREDCVTNIVVDSAVAPATCEVNMHFELPGATGGEALERLMSLDIEKLVNEACEHAKHALYITSEEAHAPPDGDKQSDA